MAKATLERLQKEVSLVEENLEDISFGLYKPHYDFATSTAYKAKLDEIYERQKGLIKSERAILFGTEWTVGGSVKEGARMQKQYSKLMLRAFNGECDAATARVTWNNIVRMQERLSKAFSAINNLGGVMQISITPEYLDLRLQELRLTHELEEKKREEVEEQRQIREQMREEEKVQREIDKALKEAETEEERFEKALELERARAEIAKARGVEMDNINARVRELESLLEDARAKRERAIFRGQTTRSGHVYIISNIGSFGENVFKIGMTRRLEPMDRVKELGDASVPFEFDVHGMVYAEDAPALECEIHQNFAGRRINLVNMRKEFFYVGLSELDEFLKSRKLNIELTMLAEARQYRETLTLRQKASEASQSPKENSATFPAELFART